jgi:hypothetical protein
MADSNPAPSSPLMLTAGDAARLADRLCRRQSSPTIAGQVAALEAECGVAGRLIRVMLRQVHSSDVFTLPEV